MPLVRAEAAEGSVGAPSARGYAGAVPPTVASALRAAIAALTSSPTPRSDAEELLSRLLDVSRARVPLIGEQTLASEQSTRLESWLRRRATHEPVQYITGRAAFRHLDLAVDPRVLVPRPETEGLVEAVLEALREAGARWPAPRLLELGTGSGAIALALASEWPAAVVTATDGSAAALEVARANAAAAGLAERVRILAGDWFTAVGAGERFEAVVSNPPYVAADEWDALPEDVRGFEPRAALHSGPDGLDATRAIVARAPEHLVAGGLLALELAEARADLVAGWLRGEPAWAAVEVRADLAGRPRCLLARRAGLAPGG